ncbi:MAG: polysaccharide biosynthesis/export family protein [Cyanobacteriota bacterium]
MNFSLKIVIVILIIIFAQTITLTSVAADYKGDVYFSKFDKGNSSLKFYLSENRNFIARKYILGPNDVINISFLGVPELNQEKIRIQPDGNVTIALLNTVNVAGFTIDELKELLVEKYKFYLKDPQVTINLVETKPFIVYISGAVVNPGSYELDTNTSESQFLNNTKPELRIMRKSPLLSNILVAAGGINFDADLERIIIKNRLEDISFEVNLLELLEQGDSNQDIYLMAGDVVYVPKLPTPLAVTNDNYKKYAGSTISPRTIPVKILGYVNNPGLIELDSSRSRNINSAIAAAGGYLKNAVYPPKKVYLSRIDNNGILVTTAINPMKTDMTVMPNDIIYVPDKPRPLIGKAFDFMNRLITPANSFASTYNNWALMFDPKRYQVNVISK